MEVNSENILRISRSDDILLDASDEKRGTPSIDGKRVLGMGNWKRRWLKELVMTGGAPAASDQTPDDASILASFFRSLALQPLQIGSRISKITFAHRYVFISENSKGSFETIVWGLCCKAHQSLIQHLF